MVQGGLGACGAAAAYTGRCSRSASELPGPLWESLELATSLCSCFT